VFERVKASFTRQQVMATLGAELVAATPGHVAIELPYSEALTQQHGFLHAGVVATVMDSACGYAAFTLMPEDAGVLSIEFKTNLLAPARGQRFRFEGTVIKAGRTISVCEGKCLADDGKLVATMTCTLMTVRDREGVVG
jgi:uncharacterized protein (TIGR00369 family)